jgi:hypothetical protein
LDHSRGDESGGQIKAPWACERNYNSARRQLFDHCGGQGRIGKLGGSVEWSCPIQLIFARNAVVG